MSSLKTIDSQTLKLVDYLIAKHKQTKTNLDLTTDYSFGVQFYTYNKYIVTHMRGKDVKGGKGKHAPHPFVINIGKRFDIDFNFFYDESMAVEDAFLTEDRASYGFNKKFVEEVFEEIDKRFELFIQENRQLKSKEEREYCKESETNLFNIKTHLYKLLSGNTLTEKKSEIIEMFDRMILLSRKKIDALLSVISLEQDITTLNKEVVSKAEVKILELERNILKLTSDLAECNKMAFEAQKGQTDALKELLALKSKDR